MMFQLAKKIFLFILSVSFVAVSLCAIGSFMGGVLILTAEALPRVGFAIFLLSQDTATAMDLFNESKQEIVKGLVLIIVPVLLCIALERIVCPYLFQLGILNYGSRLRLLKNNSDKNL